MYVFILHQSVDNDAAAADDDNEDGEDEDMTVAAPSMKSAASSLPISASRSSSKSASSSSTSTGALSSVSARKAIFDAKPVDAVASSLPFVRGSAAATGSGMKTPMKSLAAYAFGQTSFGSSTSSSSSSSSAGTGNAVAEPQTPTMMTEMKKRARVDTPMSAQQPSHSAATDAASKMTRSTARNKNRLARMEDVAEETDGGHKSKKPKTDK